jgi:hypothetical protein
VVEIRVEAMADPVVDLAAASMAAAAALAYQVKEMPVEILIESIHNMSAAVVVELVAQVEIPRAQWAELVDLRAQHIHHGQQLHQQESVELMPAAAVVDLDVLPLAQNTTAERLAAVVVLAALAYMAALQMLRPTQAAVVVVEQSARSLLDIIILLAMVALVLSLFVIQSKENTWRTLQK